MKKWIKFFVGLFLSFQSNIATSTQGYYSIPLRLNNEVNIEYAQDNIPHEVGQVTGSFTDSLLTDSYALTMFSDKVGEVNGKGIYATQVKGIGFTLQVNGVDINAEKQLSQGIGRAYGSLSVVSTLVIYEKLPSGSYLLTSPQNIAQVELAEGFKPLGINLFVVQPIRVKQKTCELRSEKNQQVQLRSIMLNELMTNKEVFGNNFNIQLSCDSNVRADVMFYDQIAPSNTSECLMLSPESTAEGVCIAIRKNSDNQKVQLGSRWTFSEAQSNPFEIIRQFSASYVKDGNPTAGKVKAMATISFTYH